MRGIVTGLTQDELQQVIVWARRQGDSDSVSSETRVNQQGAYVIHGPPAGRVRVVADLANRRQVWKFVEMPDAGEVVANLEFEPGWRLSGAISRSARPVSPMWVYIEGSSAQGSFSYGTSTTDKGEYSISGLRDGEYRITVGGFTTKPFQVSGDTVFNIEIPDRQLAGRVLEHQSRAPVVAADVYLWPAQSGSAARRVQTSSDHFGQFAMIGVEPGEYILSVYRSGHALFRERITYREPAAPVTILLRPDSGVAITVANDASARRPLRALYAVEQRDDGGGIHVRLPLDENGVGYMPSALAGSTLTVYAQGYLPYRVKVWDGQVFSMPLERQAKN